MAKRVKAKSNRGRKKKRFPSIVYRLTWSLDPVKNAGLIALLESIPPRQRSQYILDIVLGNVEFSMMAPAKMVDKIAEDEIAEKEIDLAGDGW